MRCCLGLGLWAAVTTVLGLQVGCCDGSGVRSANQALAVEAVAGQTGNLADGDWGTIRGQVVFAGSQLSKEEIDVKNLAKIKEDQDHCLEKGPLYRERWVINPKSKGVRWVVVFLKAPADQPLPIHESLKEVNPKEVVVDQPRCSFEPHVFPLRKGQKLVAKNSSPISHNFTITGFANQYNRQTAPGKSEVFELIPEPRAIKVSCGAHPWMEGYTWVFDHPYYAVTDADGKFEIKLAPAGKRTLVIWHETGFLGGPKGREGQALEIKAGAETDLGRFELKPG